MQNYTTPISKSTRVRSPERKGLKTMERLKNTIFEMMLNEELSAASERSQHMKAQHHTRFFALKNVLEECDMTAAYYEYR